MRFIKAVSGTLFALVTSVVVAFPAGAIGTGPFEPAPLKPESPVIISGYSYVGPRLVYVQLFNTLAVPVDVSGWKLEYTIKGQESPVQIATLGGLIKPLNYIVAGDTSSLPAVDFGYTLDIPPEITANASLIRLLPFTAYANHEVTLKYDVHSNYWQRNISASTGKYLSTFASFVPDATYVLFGDGLYEYPENTSLQISEILANPHDCSPGETAIECHDYVKLYNPTNQTINLAGFRLRTGIQGQSVTASNTFALSGSMPAGHYAVIAKSADGRSLSILNSGGFVWLEDTYGIKRYDTTVQEYADASSDSKKGQAWAYDSHDGTWKWTMQPTPGDSPNVFPPVAVKAVASAATGTLVPCKEGQYRSEETNRCRSLAATATGLVACAPDQERNPDTNRCRKIASTVSTLAPCKEGQERNPDTNRCRNVASSIPQAAFSVEPVADAGKAFVGWWALGGVGVLALGYGVWEWHRELFGAIRKVGTFFTIGK